MLNELLEKEIKEHAAEKYPFECCGLIVDSDQGLKVVPCDNISSFPERSFIINPRDVDKFDIETITAFYHSHKSDIDFSLADLAFSEKLQKTCIMYCNDYDTFKVYNPNGMEIPYVGRPFFSGVLDCFKLCKDYYRRELNIVFKGDLNPPEKSNIIDWNKYEVTHNTKMVDYLESNSFVKVDNLKKHDIIIMRSPNSSYPTHMMVYLGDNQILNHFTEFSQIESYKNSFKRLTVGFYRHTDLL